MQELIYIAIGFVLGLYIAFTHFKLLSLNKKIDNVKNGFPSTVDIAKEILNIKMPIGELPEETINMIKKEQNKSPKDTYFG